MAGHGGGGGGGKKKGGPLAAIRGNGCLTYIALWIVGLVLLVSGVCAAGSGILSRIGLPIPGAGATTSSSGSASAPSRWPPRRRSRRAPRRRPSP